MFVISRIVNLLLKTNGREQKVSFCYFCNWSALVVARRVGGGDARLKVLFRAG